MEPTPLKLRFKNVSKTAKRFKIELVSTVKSYPHLDSTPPLAPGKAWEQTFYFFPSLEKEVRFQLLIKTKQAKKFKQARGKRTIIDASARVLLKDDPVFTNLIQLLVIVASMFSIFVTWNQVLLITREGLGAVRLPDQLRVIGFILLAELVLFFPFMFLLTKLQSSVILEELELAFSENPLSYKYEKGKGKGFRRGAKILSRNFLKAVQLMFFAGFMGLLYVLAKNGYATYLALSRNVSDKDAFFLGIGIITVTVLVFTVLPSLFEPSTVRGSELELRGMIQRFIPISAFKEGMTSEVGIEVKNTTRARGLRIVFEGTDNVSPHQVELHAEPNEVIKFKVAITPSSRGEKSLLAIIYPLFDKDENYIDPEEAEPLQEQIISYTVLPQTRLGLTEDQVEFLKQLVGVASFVGVGIFIASKYVTIENVFTTLRDILPGLIVAQIPIVYVYLALKNKFMKVKVKNE